MSFSNLKRLIGPAPSEMDRTELMKKLSLERDRVRMTLTWFKTTKWAEKTSVEKKTGGKPASKPSTIMKKHGVTTEQLKQALLLMQQEGKVND